MRAIATGDLHNLVFQADYRIIPAVMRPPIDPPPRSRVMNCIERGPGPVPLWLRPGPGQARKV
jgi:hypothetical protein